MDNNSIITIWTKYPTGKIPKGTFCEHCARFNARNMTVTTLVLNQEEAKITADHTNFFKIYDALDRDKDGRQNVDHAFVVRVPSDDFTTEKNEVSEARWFALDSLPENIAFDHQLMIEDYKKTV